METTNRNAQNPDAAKTPENNQNEYKSNEQIPSNDATPENLKAPAEKEANDANVLHTEQKSQENADILNNDKNDEDDTKTGGNSNIRTYLGSDKLNEKIASITQKYNEHKLRAESILSKYTMGVVYE